MSTLPIIENCDGCGACCMDVRTPPFIPGHDFERLPAELQRDVLDGARRDAPQDALCYWFDPDTRRCRHYDHRPDICRDFERGSPECHRWRELKGI